MELPPQRETTVASSKFSTQASYHEVLDGGGASRDRTGDLLLAKQALSQLSYGPGSEPRWVVGLGRFELPASPLSGVRSDQLSYRPF